MAPVPQGSSPPDWQRRSLTVLVADVVGYSRLMEADEAGTHARMRSLRVDAIDPRIVSHRGEVIKHTGDGFLACFESAADALRCTAEFQTAIAASEAQQAPDRRIAFRCGLNVESVIVDGSDVFGSGVNIAARLQQHAPAGGVVLSEAVKDAVGGDVGPLPLEDLGDIHLRNISRSVHAYACAFSDAAPMGTGIVREDGRAHLPTLAVLPLHNLSQDPADAYLAEGIIEELIVSLSAIRYLFVISRGSVLGFGPDATTETVTQRLGVRYLLGGGVRRDGAKLRFMLELRDASSGSVLWAERYDCALHELFDMQQDVLERLVSSVASHVRTAEIRRARRKPPDRLDAYDHLLRALDLLYRLDLASFSKARVLLEHAIDADRDYAAPYTYAAKWHVFNVGQGWSSDPQQDGAEALRLACAALERDPSDSLAHAVCGHVQGMLLRDYDAALDSFDRALSAARGNAWAWLFSSGTRGFIGDARQGVDQAERALRLSPIDQQAFYFSNFLAQNHYLNNSLDDAIAWSRKALRHNPRFLAAARLAAGSLAAAGRFDEARRASAHLMGLQPGFSIASYGARCPFRDPAVVDRYLEHLSLAGLPA